MLKSLVVVAFVIWGSFVKAESKFDIETAIKKAGLSKQDLGIYLSEGTGKHEKIVINLNGEALMIPASITKLATASAVLDGLPPGHRIKTKLLMATKPQGEIHKGHLYLQGGGDPSFVSENMWYLVNAFTRHGVKKIEGDIYVDDSLFDTVRYDSSRQKERVDRAYDAPAGAMSFNWNSVNIFIQPRKVGEAPNIIVDPENEYIRLINTAKTVSGGANKLIVDRQESKNFAGDTLKISGTVGVNHPELLVFKNITQPDIWSGFNLRSFLAQRGISVTGDVKTGTAPKNAVLVAESESKPVEQMVADMNKFSNNYVAEMLTKNLGIRKKTHKISLQDGMSYIEEHLRKLGIPSEQMRIQSPSGLSRQNKMSAFAMWKVLDAAHDNFQVQPEFMNSLPIAGVDGTLKRRMKGTSAERWVRAKTGFLTNVVSLAGYAGNDKGSLYTFAFIYNGSKDEAKVRQFFDEILINLLKSVD